MTRTARTVLVTLWMTTPADGFAQWGDNASTWAKGLNIGAVIIDGSVRDIANVRKLLSWIAARRGAGALALAQELLARADDREDREPPADAPVAARASTCRSPTRATCCTSLPGPKIR